MNCTQKMMTGALALLVPCFAGCESSSFSAYETEVLSAMVLPESAPPSPTNGVADDEGAARLGHLFFFDARFSGPLGPTNDGMTGGSLGPAGAIGTVACASCHDPANGGTDHRSSGGTSFAAARTGRNAPSVLNAAFSDWQFWDGRKDSLWSQALGPIESPAEHNTCRTHVVALMAEHYADDYESVFGVSLPDMTDTDRFPNTNETDPAACRPGGSAWNTMTADDQFAINQAFANFGKAVGAYERKLITPNSPFDIYFRDGDESAMSPEAIRGAKLFMGRASCDECHAGVLFANQEFRNHGVPQYGDFVGNEDVGRAQGLLDVQGDEFNGAGAFSDDVEAGAAKLAGASTDDLVGAFKVPTLRNSSRSAPFFHTGNVETLWDVMVWYKEAAGSDRFAGERDAAADAPLLLSDQDMLDLVAFMEALEGSVDSQWTEAPALPGVGQ